MLASVLAEVKGLVDKRFLLGSFFPVLSFVTAGDLLYTAANGGIDSQIDAWEAYSATVQAIIAVGVLAAVLLTAAVLSASGLLVVQLFEGYFLPKYISKRWILTESVRKAESRGNTELRFPHTDLMPTALGNVLRAAEQYPQRLYGARTVVVWPRLFLVLPAAVVGPMSSAADTMQFLLNVCLCSVTFAILGAAYAGVEGLGAVLYLMTLSGGLIVARFAYRGAVETAIDYGLTLRGAFDLHRNDLLTKLGRAIPASKDEEHRLWSEVSTRLQLGEAGPVRYTTATSK